MSTAVAYADTRRPYRESVLTKHGHSLDFHCVPVAGSMDWIITCDQDNLLCLRVSDASNFTYKALKAMGLD